MFPEIKGTEEVLAQGRFLHKDVVNAMISTCNESFTQCENFAGLYQGEEWLHNWVRQNIRYYEDKTDQYIKEPARLVHDRAGDCKGYSIFIWSVLKCAGIESVLRFVSYDEKASNPTHVYIVTKNGFVLDACLESANVELPHKWHIDIKPENGKIQKLDMKQNLIRVGATPQSTINEGQLQAAYIAEYLQAKAQTEQTIVNGTNVGNVYAQAYNALENEMNNTRVNGAFTGLVTQVKNLVNTGVQAVSQLEQKFIGEIMEQILPKAAPFFLYAFIVNELALKALPASIAKKRALQVKILKVISDLTGISSATIMLKIRTAIVKLAGKEPEQILYEMAGGSSSAQTQTQTPPPKTINPNGTIEPVTKGGLVTPSVTKGGTKVGIAPVIITAIISAVAGLLPSVLKLFQKKGETAPTSKEMQDAAPSDADEKDLKAAGIGELIKGGAGFLGNAIGFFTGGKGGTEPKSTPPLTQDTPDPAPAPNEGNNTGLLIAAGLGLFLFMKK